MKKIVLGLAMALSLNVYATDGDLVLPGERWLAEFNQYLCYAFGENVSAPTAFGDMNVAFERMTTDRSLDNALLKATFEEDGVQCRYSALLFADNVAQVSYFVESKAYATNGGSQCEKGKALLDGLLEVNKYLYYGHPHNVALMLPVADAEAICGSGARTVGINFEVKGIVSPN